MQKITPHLWYDREAVEAAEFYTRNLPDSKITNLNTIYDTPSGDTDIVSFELFDQPFMFANTSSGHRGATPHSVAPRRSRRPPATSRADTRFLNASPTHPPHTKSGPRTDLLGTAVKSHFGRQQGS